MAKTACDEHQHDNIKETAFDELLLQSELVAAKSHRDRINVGKSTVLNALLGDKFTQTSLRRATAAVNHFKIIQPNDENYYSNVRVDEEAVKPQSKKLWHLIRVESSGGDVEMDVSTAETTHAEIAKDNESLRMVDKDGVVERTFEIKVESTICKMRKDTQLVLVDIPGINEADSSKKYKDYVEQNWDTFDCVILVMDAIQGANTQEQVELLKFVKSNNQSKKHIPTIILGNKVDDPDDLEKMMLVGEARDKCVEIFGKRCSEEALKVLLDGAKGNVNYEKKRMLGAVFIPISAMNAFIYRKASHLTPETLDQFDKDLIDKIGKDEVGRKWKSMTKQQKTQTIKSAIGDTEAYEERLADTNFDKFLSVLSYFVGGDNAQRELIARQVDALLKSIASDSSKFIGKTIRDVHPMLKSLGKPTAFLKDRFWEAFKNRVVTALESVKTNVDPSSLASPIQELETYYEFSRFLTDKSETDKVVVHMKDLVQRQISLVTTVEKSWNLQTFLQETRVMTIGWCAGAQCCHGYAAGCNTQFKSNGVYKCCGQIPPQRLGSNDHWKIPDVLKWSNLSDHDWTELLFAMLLPSTDIQYGISLGKDRQSLENLLRKFSCRYNPDIIRYKGNCSNNEWEYIEAVRLMAATPMSYSTMKDAIVKITMPPELSDPSHWGFLGWKYVTLVRRHEGAY